MASWFGGRRGGQRQQAGNARVNPHSHHFNNQGTIECLSCGTVQPYTLHRCMECGEDPWAEPAAGWAGVPQPSAPPSPYGAASEPSTQSSAPPPPATSEVGAIVAMGIEESWARLALSRCNNNTERAIAFCFENDMATLVAAAGSAAAAAGGAFGGDEPASPGSADRNAYDALASDHAECAICFEPLCNPEVNLAHMPLTRSTTCRCRRRSFRTSLLTLMICIPTRTLALTLALALVVARSSWYARARILSRVH